ncbi:hypothetical protein HAX54_052534, partial [Datura stramonium]|nr:hypothetical protein [Datura stramonium]
MECRLQRNSRSVKVIFAAVDDARQNMCMSQLFRCFHLLIRRHKLRDLKSDISKARANSSFK